MSLALVPAEGRVLDRILDERYALGNQGLEDHAFRRWHQAQMQTAWGRAHRHPVALLDGGTLLASATWHALGGILDQQPVQVCGIGNVLTHSPDGDEAPARALVGQLLEQAVASGAEVALLLSAMDPDWCRQANFHSITPPTVEVTLEPTRRPGAPMMLVRAGENRDLAAIAAMGQVRSAPFRFHLDRDADFIQHAIATKRLLAGLGATGARELQFFIAEEGITAAAYVVLSVVDRTWTIQECGDRDPSGARTGALLQALVAREPGARPPVVRGWLPPTFAPPQVALASLDATTPKVLASLLGPRRAEAPLTPGDCVYWCNDLF